MSYGWSYDQIYWLVAGSLELRQLHDHRPDLAAPQPALGQILQQRDNIKQLWFVVHSHTWICTNSLPCR